MEPSPCIPPPLRAFQRDQERDLKHPGLVDLISTKQNKQTTLLHGLVFFLTIQFCSKNLVSQSINSSKIVCS